MRFHWAIPLAYVMALMLLPLPALKMDPFSGQEESGGSASESSLSLPKDTNQFSIRCVAQNRNITMGVQEFLLYTVAAEMPVSYGPEALKAQAVASYTYYCFQRQQQQLSPTADLEGADFSDVPSCFPEGYSLDALRERWGSSFDENISALQKAIQSVKGKAITYRDEPILAVYHAISSGYTESAASVWGTDYPYLQSVPSPGDTLADDYETTVSFAPAQLAAALADISNINLSGMADTWLDSATYTASGSVDTQKIGGIPFTGRQLRKLLELRSSAFTVAYDGKFFCFTVHGYGHGVGMSQYGAGYLARQGMSWEEILHYYYSGVKIDSDYGFPS